MTSRRSGPLPPRCFCVSGSSTCSQMATRVAICEQVEDPETQKQRGGKGPLRREVIRILTPGTLTEDDLLPPRDHNYLAALGRPRAAR